MDLAITVFSVLNATLTYFQLIEMVRVLSSRKNLITVMPNLNAPSNSKECLRKIPSSLLRVALRLICTMSAQTRLVLTIIARNQRNSWYIGGGSRPAGMKEKLNLPGDVLADHDAIPRIISGVNTHFSGIIRTTTGKRVWVGVPSLRNVSIVIIWNSSLADIEISPKIQIVKCNAPFFG